ncbi:MAG: YIP1 family protein [Anaerolineae bacterium]
MLERIVQRVQRMVRFDHSVYREIEHDEKATTEAFVIVAVVSVFAALGAALAPGAGGFAWTFVSQLVLALVSWLLWSLVTMLVGTRIFGGQATFWGMARTLGYAFAPRVLSILSALACLGILISWVAWGLSLVLAFFAVRETLELSTEKAILTVLIGWIVVAALSFVLAFTPIF